MAFGKRFDEWDRVSLLASLIHNSQPGRPHRGPEAFNLFLAEQQPEGAVVTTVEQFNAIVKGQMGKVT